MFPVKIFDGKGNEKPGLSGKEASALFWKNAVNEPVSGKGPDFGMEIKCRGCETYFYKTSRGHKFHAKECQLKFYRAKIKGKLFEKVCKGCGEMFKGTKSRVYCNSPCTYHRTKKQGER